MALLANPVTKIGSNLLSAEQQQRMIEDKKFVDLCAKQLKQIMLAHDLTNIKVAALADTPVAYVSRLRNGALSQRNYIKIIRALPPAARIDYMVKVFDLDETELNNFLIERQRQRK
jgi:hypothetical protein